MGGWAMRAALTLFVALAASACEQPGAQVVPSTSTQPSGQLSCKLPVAALYSPAVGGFISVPGGGFAPDAASNATYDVAARRWLPVPRNDVSPDGGSYVTSEVRDGPITTVRSTEVASGKTRILWSGHGNYRAVSYTGRRVGLVRTFPPATEYSSSTEQVYWLEFGGRQAVLAGPQVPTQWARWEAVGADAAWSVRVGQPPPAPYATGPKPAQTSGLRLFTDTLDRLDGATGAVRSWITLPEMNLDILGLDLHDRPIVSVRGYSTGVRRILVLNGPNSTTDLYSGPDLLFTPRSALADSHGIWFDSVDTESIWLYSSGDGLRRIYAEPPLPRPSFDPVTFQPVRVPAGHVLAGPCL